MKQIIFLFILLLLLVPACRKNKSNIITYDLNRRDYIETIDAVGTVQAVNNFTMMAPRVNMTNILKVTHLAEDGAHVKKGDTICIFDEPNTFNFLDQVKRELQTMEGELKQLEANNAMELAVLNAQVETNKAQTAISMLDSLKMKFATPVEKQLLTLEMEKVNIEKNKLQKKFAAQKRINISEVNKMRSRMMIHKNRVQLYEGQINSLKLVSPSDGIVMHVESYRLEGNSISIGKIEEGSSTLSGMSVLQIPDLRLVQVSIEVPEADYKRIQPGQKVKIRVDAAANLMTTGKIKRKTLQKKNPLEQTAIKSYEVIVSVDSCHLRMKPGLSAYCQIIVNQVKDTIVVPSVAIFVRDSAKVVYVADDEKFIPVIIETGLTNSAFSIISKGLMGNETIALTQPSHNLIREKASTKPERTDAAGTHKKDTVSEKAVSKGSSINKLKSVNYLIKK